jgi:hypothetical protein
VFVNDKCSSSDKTDEIVAARIFKHCIGCNNMMGLQEFSAATGFNVLCLKDFMNSN